MLVFQVSGKQCNLQDVCCKLGLYSHILAFGTTILLWASMLLLSSNCARWVSIYFSYGLVLQSDLLTLPKVYD